MTKLRLPGGLAGYCWSIVVIVYLVITEYTLIAKVRIGSRRLTIQTQTEPPWLGMLKTMLEYKCAHAGIVFKEVDEAYTTRSCPP